MLDKKRLSQSQNSARSSTAFRKWKKSIIAADTPISIGHCFHCCLIYRPVSPRSEISRDRDNSTSLVESQLTTLRSCRSSRSLCYITLPSIFFIKYSTIAYFSDNNFNTFPWIDSSLFIEISISPTSQFRFYLSRKKKMKKWYLSSPDSSRFSWWNPIVRNVRLLFFRSSSFLVRFSRFLIWPSRARLSFHFNAWSRTRSERATHPPISNPFLYAPIRVE